MPYPQVLPTAAMNANLAALIAATTGPLNGAKLRVYVNAVSLTPAIVLADFTEATFTGYAAVAVTWGTILNATDGTVFVPGGGIEFACTTAGTTQTAYGVYLTNSAGSTLLAAWSLEVPVGITNPGDGFVWPLSFGYSGQ